MITSYNIEISLRKYLMDKYGLPVELRKQGWSPPDTRPYYTVNSPTSTPTVLTKNKTLINSRVLIEVGCFADTISGLASLQKDVLNDIMYGSIPLLDDSGADIGSFSFKEIVSINDITDDTQSTSNESSINRVYIECRTEIAYVKI